MSDKTGIAWTDSTWNPTVGCSLVSPGCTNCYAQVQAAHIVRLAAGKPSHYDGTTKAINGNPVWTGKVNRAHVGIFFAPLRWKKPRRIFVNSMSDLFHESVSDETIDEIFAIMALCPQHTFQVLTKRAKRMREYLSHIDREFHGSPDNLNERFGEHCVQFTGDPCAAGWFEDHVDFPLPNVWLGVSTEDQQRVDERVPDLLATPAAVRWVSAEPLLGPLQIAEYMPNELWNDIPSWKQPELDWIVVGGESGDGYRPMQIEWAESIAAQCKNAGTAFFFKQDSARKPGQRGRASDELRARKEFPK